MLLKTVLGGVLIVIPSIMAQTEVAPNSWRGLIPLRSNRDQVEKLLGRPKDSIGPRLIYENESERVDVRYADASCSEAWDVPKDTVISMEVHPRKSIRIEELRLDPKKYIRFQWAHPDNWVVYMNKAEGVWVHTIIWDSRGEEVYFFEYLPTAKDESLRCK
jgi:hypothetical protein